MSQIDDRRLEIFNADVLSQTTEARGGFFDPGPNGVNARAEAYFQSLEDEFGGMGYKDYVTSNIARQVSHIVNMGMFARPTRFFFEITRLNSKANERLVRNCVNITMPGKSIASQPLKIYGPPSEFPYDMNFTNEMSMSFRVGEDYWERDFFEQWLDSAISTTTHDVRYPDEYRTSMRIYQLDRRDNKIYCAELYDVFCKTIGEIQMSPDSSDTITTIDATIAFSEYRIIGKRNFPWNPSQNRGEMQLSDRARTLQKQAQDASAREQQNRNTAASSARADIEFLRSDTPSSSAGGFSPFKLEITE